MLSIREMYGRSPHGLSVDTRFGTQSGHGVSTFTNFASMPHFADVGRVEVLDEIEEVPMTELRRKYTDGW